MAKDGGGGKADATLVAAAYRLGQSYVPADYSTIFNKQYEGLIAAYKAKSEAAGDIFEAATESVGDVLEAKQKRQKETSEVDDPLTEHESFMPDDYTEPEDRVRVKGEDKEVSTTPQVEAEKKLSFKEWVLEDPVTRSGPSATSDYRVYLDKDTTFTDVNRDLEKEINKMNTDNTSSKMTNLSNYLENGGTFGDLQYDATEIAFNDIKSQLEAINDKTFLSKEDKRNQSKLRKKAERLRTTINESVASIKGYTQLYKTGKINLEQSFENDYEGSDGTIHQGADLAALVGQVFDPDADSTIDQFELFYSKNGQKMYRYAPGRAGIEYNRNKGIKGKKIPKSQWKTISEKSLFGQIVPIDEQTVLDANAEMTRVASMAAEFTTGADNTKIATYTDFSQIEDISYNNYLKLFNNAPNPRDITQRDILVGNTTRNYKDDQLQNMEIDESIINQETVGSDILTMADLNNDGFVNEGDAKWAEDNELSTEEMIKHVQAKDKLIEMLTNPKTQAEKEVAAKNFAKYWTHHAKTAFVDKQKRVGLAKRSSITTTTSEAVTTFPSLGNASYTYGPDGNKKWLKPGIKQQAYDFFSTPQKIGAEYHGQHAFYVQTEIDDKMMWTAYKSLNDMRKGKSPIDNYSAKDVFGFETGVNISGTTEEEVVTEIPKVDKFKIPKASADNFAWNANIDTVLNNWEIDYPDFTFVRKGGKIKVTAPNGKIKEFSGIGSMQGNKETQAAAFNNWMEKNKKTE
mgnify:CR=1 FL=1